MNTYLFGFGVGQETAPIPMTNQSQVSTVSTIYYLFQDSPTAADKRVTVHSDSAARPNIDL